MRLVVKNILWILTLVIISFACKKNEDIGIEQSEYFIKFYGGSLNDVGHDVIQDGDHGYVIIGSTTNENEETDVFLIKTDQYGNQLWQKTFGDTLNDIGMCLSITSDGGYIIAGTTTDPDRNENIYLVKTNNNGDLIWEKSYGNESQEEGYCVKQTSDGGYVVVGLTDDENSGNGNPQGENDIFLIRLNENGDSLWSKSYGGSLSERGTDVCEKDDGGFVILGTTYSFSEPGQGGANIILIETNDLGMLIDKYTYGETGDETGASLVKLSDGYLLTGLLMNTANNSDIYCIRTTFDIHSVSWETNLGGTGNEYCEKAIQAANGDFIIVGATESYGEGGTDSYLIEIDQSGNEVRSAAFGGAGDEKGNAVVESDLGGFAFVGSTLTEENSMISLTKVNDVFELK